MEDKDQQEQLPIHLILGASDYAIVNTDCRPKVGKLGEPVGEFTKLGWTLMSAGAEIDTKIVFHAKSSLLGYKKLFVVLMLWDWKRVKALLTVQFTVNLESN